MAVAGLLLLVVGDETAVGLEGLLLVGIRHVLAARQGTTCRQRGSTEGDNAGDDVTAGDGGGVVGDDLRATRQH